MLETDSPFMRPDREYLPELKSLRQGRCEPCVLPAVCNAVAECYGVPNPNPNPDPDPEPNATANSNPNRNQVPPSAVARVTTANAVGFFGLE